MVTETARKAAEDAENRKGRRRLSVVFALIWILAVIIIAKLRDDIPVYMLLIATLFFFMLVPSMNDLVRDYDKFIARLKSKAGSPNVDR